MQNSPKSPIKNEILSSYDLMKKYNGFNGFFYVVAWNKIYKKELFNNVKFPYGKIHEDEFTAHIIANECKKIFTTDEIMYYYVQRKGSITASKALKSHTDSFEALASRCEFYIDNGKNDLIGGTFCSLQSLYFSIRNLMFKEDTKQVKKCDAIFKETYNKCKKNLSLKYRIYGSFPKTIYMLKYILKRIKNNRD